MNVAPRLRNNVMANAIGRFSSVGLAIFFTPLYIHFLGIEAYGLIGFYITLQSSIGFLEMGLSRACTRELARYSGGGEAASHQMMLDTLRSLESIYWLVAILLGAGLTAASSWIATSWLSSKIFTSEELSQLLIIVAWVIAMRWPMGIYIGALMGLQRQVCLNVARVSISLLNWGGSTLVLWLVRPDIQSYFQWQITVALVATVLLWWLAWRAMPGSLLQGRPSFVVIRRIVPFAVGVGGNEVLSVVLRQSDKLILSAMLPLNQFGYYALASVIASAVPMLASPISNAVFPRFSQMIGVDVLRPRLSSLYHLASQAVAVLVIPFGLLIAFFPHEILFVYTGDVGVAEGSEIVLAVLVVSKILHASMVVPYALQLAYGWVRLSLLINIISVIWLVPAIYWLVGIYGPVGAAVAWLIVTIGYVGVGMPIMHRRLLVGEWGRWAWRTMAAPMTMVTTFLLLAHWFLADKLLVSSRWFQGEILLSVGAVALMLAAFSAKDLRRWIGRQGLNGDEYR